MIIAREGEERDDDEDESEEEKRVRILRESVQKSTKVQFFVQRYTPTHP
jgi:hypothetical protein